MWTWSISATGKKQDVVREVMAYPPPKIDMASVEPDAKGRLVPKVCASLHGLEAKQPEEWESLKTAVRERGGSKDEEDSITAETYVANEVDLPKEHRDKFNQARTDVLARLTNIPDGAMCSVSVSGNNIEYKAVVRNLSEEDAQLRREDK